MLASVVAGAAVEPGSVSVLASDGWLRRNRARPVPVPCRSSETGAGVVLEPEFRSPADSGLGKLRTWSFEV
ncbi:hypothetical protein F9C11_08805 [Amycolatopsis sp. VS8301801F10]|uniref:hypothetical protein n=1 Tax=Amycolatopsis sp. VS8301801F10 TaxID=2652442 RepID=UPI0038FC6087